VPSFTGLTREQCKWLAEQGQLKIKFDGKGERVITQSLPAGSPIVGEDGKPIKVLLTLGDLPGATQAQGTKGIMPELRGKTKRQALALLAPLGLHVSFKGEGVVRSQFPPAGRAIQTNMPCELNCDLPVANTTSSGSGGKS
jgi:stage V sporulation protein D (sporulation-specific penicillin-binding protein)